MKIAYFILVLYTLTLLGALMGIVYLIIRRRRVKKRENFEKRSN